MGPPAPVVVTGSSSAVSSATGIASVVWARILSTGATSTASASVGVNTIALPVRGGGFTPSSIVAPPIAPGAPDYGSDISTFVTNDEGVADLDPYFIIIGSRQTLAEQIVRGWTMLNGCLWDSPDEGVDVRDYMSDVFDGGGSKAFSVASNLELEGENDERVATCEVDVTQSAAGDALDIEAKIDPITGETFQLVVSITDVTVELLAP